MNIYFKSILITSTLTLVSLCSLQSVYAKETITVYAAASLMDAMKEIKQVYEQQNNIQIKTSYAGSSILAKQIKSGAPVNLFISADEAWMNYLQQYQLIQPQNRKNLLSNRLVLIAPKNQNFKVTMSKSFQLSKVIHGKLCTGDTQSVPVGKYAKESLIALGWWEQLKPKIVETSDVRAALNFVARGECQAGIVYATDALMNKNVHVVDVFPNSTHRPIIYPVGIVHKNQNTVKFYNFLSSAPAIKIFKTYGFTVIHHSI